MLDFLDGMKIAFIFNMTGYQQYEICIDTCLKCAAICQYCASACTKDPNITEMRQCIQLNMECAAICTASANLMSLSSEQIKEVLKLCAKMCDLCAEECNKHKHDHCLQCAEICSKCADECELIAH